MVTARPAAHNPRLVAGLGSSRSIAGKMTETRNADARDETQHTLVVPNSINMVSLLGPADEHLAVMEKAFDADVHVRGNQITLRGESRDKGGPQAP